ncbi:DUF4864 domain-containing protein [Pseudoponticoccus marisrubri]|uniref:DUF4864 domain-containing protein n=1 Tax=Pseudoponticoccus marisrubri TaxID=1685382 RepID=A0A0W7WQD6_9RHOB|nr:DUF4864 domain-containing protein [Pseudoponticoccus marisrubri]KUF12794.1 hypothetical protein AVJ23_03540 [Pseudoponticoccus marisrubri]
MRGGILGMVLSVILSGSVMAQDALPPDKGIEGVIRQQMDAFLADDVGTAFEFASPSIQGMFRTPENFGAMVRNGYPMVWRPGDVRFGDLREIGGALWQKVIVTDGAGRTFVLDYRMQQIDGAWRISGVQILPAPDVAA